VVYVENQDINLSDKDPNHYTTRLELFVHFFLHVQTIGRRLAVIY